MTTCTPQHVKTDRDPEKLPESRGRWKHTLEQDRRTVRFGCGAGVSAGGFGAGGFGGGFGDGTIFRERWST